MKAVDRRYHMIINGNTQFVIPVFQRDYSWSDHQCEQLWKDVVRVGTPQEEILHFLGSVVYVPTGDSFAGYTRWTLIDGQQRMTTLFLLVTALRDHIADTGWTGSEDSPTSRRLESYFLINLLEEGSRRHKLVLRNHDEQTLHALIERSDLPDPHSLRLKENYDLFRERLQDADPELVYRGISRLVVVDVILDRTSDDPQMIFESLNSTGLDLSPTDLIRNYILMRLPDAEQTRLYSEYWRPIEDLYRGTPGLFNNFIRDYMALVQHSSKQERTENIYYAFRQLFGDRVGHPDSLTQLLADLRDHARHYATFTSGYKVPSDLQEVMGRLRRLADVPALLVMKLFATRASNPEFTLAMLGNALELLESYLLRRAICGWPSHNHWSIFARLAYRLDAANPLESLKVGLVLLRDAYRFPSNEEFHSALVGMDLYSKRVCFGLLERLENAGSREVTDTSSLTIEHILPQNEKLSLSWRRMLGENWQEIQQTRLHRLGNLTLTGYNSSYSDRPFEEKKNLPNGFRSSAVRLNTYVSEQETWTADQIDARGKSLAARALGLWPVPIVSQEVLDRAELKEKQELAARRDLSSIQMGEYTRTLYNTLEEQVRTLDGDLVILAEWRSISFHEPAFFLEVIPRKYSLTLLLNLDFNEVEMIEGLHIEDATTYKFILNSSHNAGVLVKIWQAEQVALAMPLIRQAHRTV